MATRGQTADQADWLIGPDVVGAPFKPAPRSMKAVESQEVVYEPVRA